VPSTLISRDSTACFAWHFTFRLKLPSGISMYRHCAADHCSDKTSEVQVGFAIIKRIEWHLAAMQRLPKAFSTPSY
jgi:hypothetical protein